MATKWRVRTLCATILLVSATALITLLTRDPGGIAGSGGPIVEAMHSRRYIYEMPPGGSPRGLIFLAHGCNCRPEFFWDASPTCPQCIGLPHDRVYVRRAIAAGYAVIAVSSSGRCWNAARDGPPTATILANFQRDHGINPASTFAIGASSGGYFVSHLAATSTFNFSAIVIMIAEGVYLHESMQVLPNDHPRTLFVHMPRDKIRAKSVTKAMDILRHKGVHVSEIRCIPIEVHPLYFSERIAGIDHVTSRAIVRAFKEDGILDERGFAVGDGRSIDWRSALRKRSLVLPLLGKHGHGEHDGVVVTKYIQEELNVAFAFHELTSFPSEQVFEWLFH